MWHVTGKSENRIIIARNDPPYLPIAIAAPHQHDMEKPQRELVEDAICGFIDLLNAGEQGFRYAGVFRGAPIVIEPTDLKTLRETAAVDSPEPAGSAT